MKNLNVTEMENVLGGLVAPGPGEAERCRANEIVAFVTTNGGMGQYGLTAQDFVCFF